MFAGALAGGIVNGLTGFGTALTVLGIWLYAIPTTVAATLVILCSVASQLQTLPMIWRTILWHRVLIFVVPGILGVPIGTVRSRLSRSRTRLRELLEPGGKYQLDRAAQPDEVRETGAFDDR